MTGDLIIGLRLSGIGLGVTFLALGLVVLMIDLLVRIFPVVRGDGIKDTPVAPDPDEAQREETAVALAVGVALMESGEPLEAQDPNLGKLLEG